MGSSTEGGEELRARVRQQEVVADLGQRALESDDLDQLMYDASAAVAETLDTDYCKVLELLSDGDEVFLRQGVGWQEGLVGNATVPTDLDSQAGYTLLSETPVIVDDLRTEERFSGPELLINHDVVSGISVIIGSVETPWGVLGTHTTEKRAFTEDDATFVQNVANVLASAIDRMEKERRLRERESQLEMATTAASIGLWTWDIQENAVTADEYFTETYDMDTETITAGAPMEAFYEPIHEDDREKTWKQLERAVEETGELQAEYRVRGPAGDVKWMMAKGEVEYDDDGEPVRLNGAITEITEQKEREQELQRALDLLDKTRRIADVGGWEIDPETMEIFWTDHIFDLLEIPHDEEPSLEKAVDMYHEDDRPTVENAIEEALDSGDPFDVEARIRTPNGEVRWLRLQGEPETDDGEIVSLRGAAQDITEHKERERELERYETMVEAVWDGITAVDSDHRFERVNQAFCDMTGYDREEILGEHVTSILDEDTYEKAGELYAEVVEGTRDIVRIEYDLLTAGGDSIPVEARFGPLEYEDGTVGGVGVVRDITERKEYERQLEDSERRYRTLAENLEEMVWVSDADTREILYLNPAYEEIFGRDRESLLDDPRTFLETVHPTDRQRIEHAYTALPGEEFDEEYRIVRPDGQIRWLDVRAVPARNEEGNVSHVVGIAEDITERKERERALEESERRYRALVEHFPNGAVGLFDEDLCYTAIGGELVGVAGVKPEDRIGRSVSDIYPDELVEEVEPYFTAVFEGESTTFETEYHDRRLYAHTLPIRDVDNEVFAGMLVVQDVTERREYQRQLEESNERLEQFAYAASHDLQEPLRMVSSYLQLIERRYKDELDEDGREFLDFAVDGADRMREMIEGLLQYSRVQTKGDQFESVELDAILEDARENLQVKIEERGAEITSDSLPRIEGDAGQLRQVFQNLLSNAIEYSDESPRVHISAERNGGKWIVSVSDEGMGIEPDEQERIFEIFQRGYRTEEYSGTGIGLALCERIVERHNGELWVESEPGEGATFSFTLPAAE